MKQFQKTVIEIISALFIISIFTSNTYSQFDNFVRSNGKANNYKNDIPFVFKTDLTSQNNLNHYKEINSIFLINMLNPKYHIDSIVSKSYGKEFQKMKYNYSYDENGKLTEFFSEYENNGIH